AKATGRAGQAFPGSRHQSPGRLPSYVFPTAGFLGPLFGPEPQYRTARGRVPLAQGPDPLRSDLSASPSDGWNHDHPAEGVGQMATQAAGQQKMMMWMMPVVLTFIST